jgi:hypothetical protein
LGWAKPTREEIPGAAATSTLLEIEFEVQNGIIRKRNFNYIFGEKNLVGASI